MAGPKELDQAFASIGWKRSDRLNVISGLAMGMSVTFGLPYHHAPVSQLYLNGRPHDLCYEQIEGSPVRRHHIRLWRSDQMAPDGRPIWLASATYDSGLKPCLSGLIMHRIDPNLVAERDRLLEGLKASGWLRTSSTLGLSAAVLGCNATGDNYFTDGKIILGFLATTAPARKA